MTTRVIRSCFNASQGFRSMERAGGFKSTGSRISLEKCQVMNAVNFSAYLSQPFDNGGLSNPASTSSTGLFLVRLERRMKFAESRANGLEVLRGLPAIATGRNRFRRTNAFLLLQSAYRSTKPWNGHGFPETYKYPTRLRKNAVMASFPFFGLCLSDSQRCRL